MDLKTAIYRYCNYQERSHSEVKSKLYDLGATTPEVNALIAELIEAGLLNEERFARSYARGKFRIKQWGRIKIVQGLKRHQVSQYCIRKGLEEIDADEYMAVLRREAEKALHRYKHVSPAWKQRASAHQYLMSHGFESGLIQETLADILNPPGS